MEDGGELCLQRRRRRLFLALPEEERPKRATSSQMRFTLLVALGDQKEKAKETSKDNMEDAVANDQDHQMGKSGAKGTVQCDISCKCSGSSRQVLCYGSLVQILLSDGPARCQFFFTNVSDYLAWPTSCKEYCLVQLVFEYDLGLAQYDNTRSF